MLKMYKAKQGSNIRRRIKVFGSRSAEMRAQIVARSAVEQLGAKSGLG